MSTQVAGGGKVWNYQHKADPDAAQQKAQQLQQDAEKHRKTQLVKFILFAITPLTLLTFSLPWIVKQFLPFAPTTQEPSIAGGFGFVHMDSSPMHLVLITIGLMIVVFVLFIFATYMFDISMPVVLAGMAVLALAVLASMTMASASVKVSTDEFSFSKWATAEYGYTDLNDRGEKYGAAIYDAKDKDGNAVVLHEFESDNNRYLYENNAQLRDILDKIEAAKEAKK